MLDIACGSGTGSTYLAGKGAKMVIGADVSPDTLRDVKGWDEGKERVEFLLSDAEALPFANDSLDVIVSLETIGHLNKPDRFLAECTRVLGKKGIFVCSTPNKRIHSPLLRTPANPYHVNLYARENISRSFWILTDTLVAGVNFIQGRQRGISIPIRKFMESVENGTDPPVTAEDGREVLRVWEKITSQM